MGKKTSSKLGKVQGQKCWRFRSDCVDACLTETGGHLAPVVFDRHEGKIAPFAIAPWAEERLPKGTPKLLKVLRGDFFCLPFGGNDKAYRGEEHPPHGETANRKWRLEELAEEGDGAHLHARMILKVRPGRVDKHLVLKPGHNAVYCKHVISGMDGRICVGHHPCLQFPDRAGAGVVTTSKRQFGQVFLEPTENPEQGGYSILQPGAEFSRLDRVPMVTGEFTDVSRYPARRGFTDIVILVNDPDVPFGWVAVCFPKEGYCYFALKDPKVLPATLLWMQNGGRHYPPWNGRTTNIMGVEDIAGFFHYGLAESARKNVLTERGVPTSHKLSPGEPFVVNYVLGAVPIPDGFDQVKTITGNSKDATITLRAKSGEKVQVPLDIDFLQSGPDLE